MAHIAPARGPTSTARICTVSSGVTTATVYDPCSSFTAASGTTIIPFPASCRGMRTRPYWPGRRIRSGFGKTVRTWMVPVPFCTSRLRDVNQPLCR